MSKVTLVTSSVAILYIEIQFESTVIEIRFNVIILMFSVQSLKCYDSLNSQSTSQHKCSLWESVLCFRCKRCTSSGKVCPL